MDEIDNDKKKLLEKIKKNYSKKEIAAAIQDVWDDQHVDRNLRYRDENQWYQLYRGAKFQSLKFLLELLMGRIDYRRDSDFEVELWRWFGALLKASRNNDVDRLREKPQVAQLSPSVQNFGSMPVVVKSDCSALRDVRNGLWNYLKKHFTRDEIIDLFHDSEELEQMGNPLVPTDKKDLIDLMLLNRDLMDSGYGDGAAMMHLLRTPAKNDSEDCFPTGLKEWLRMNSLQSPSLPPVPPEPQKPFVPFEDGKLVTSVSTSGNYSGSASVERVEYRIFSTDDFPLDDEWSATGGGVGELDPAEFFEFERVVYVSSSLPTNPATIRPLKPAIIRKYPKNSLIIR